MSFSAKVTILGSDIRATPEDFDATQLEIIRALMAQLGPALAPVNTIFQLIQLGLAVKELAEAIPASLGPPPDPSALTDAVAKVVQNADVVAKFIPQLAAPIAILDSINSLVLFAEGLLAQLDGIAVQQAQNDAARATAATLSSPAREELEAIADEGDQLAADLLDALNQSSAPINVLPEILNVLADLVGLPQLPTLADLGTDAAAARGVIQDFIDALRLLLPPS